MMKKFWDNASDDNLEIKPNQEEKKMTNASSNGPNEISKRKT